MAQGLAWEVREGDSRNLLRAMPDASVDAIVTDPPYELAFMAKAWDSTGIAYSVDLWRETLRVLKPGGHLLAFGGTRTYHRMACAIEDAGFEIRDSIHWMYGSGFPKSVNVSKAIDKAAGAEREVVGSKMGLPGYSLGYGPKNSVYGNLQNKDGKCAITAPATEDANTWSGWGTALKPAHEPVVMARKPLDGTVAGNVLAHGTGAINVDGCRIPHASAADFAKHAKGVEALKARGGSFADSWKNSSDLSGANDVTSAGRWPANVLLSHAEGCVDECADGCPVAELGDAARYYYTAKPSKRERDAGLEDFPVSQGFEVCDREDGSAGADNPRAGVRTERRNTHPTVKPIAIMRYLVRLVTPPGGLVLDPFAGSGTTGCAAVLEGARFLGLELEPAHAEIARARIAHWATQVPKQGELWRAH